LSAESTPGTATVHRLLPVREVAATLGLSPMTVYRRIWNETWPSTRSGSKRLISAALIDYVMGAIDSGRSGSVEDFAAEWVAQQQKASTA
jgi:excisionase family DNA binding protein